MIANFVMTVLFNLASATPAAPPDTTHAEGAEPAVPAAVRLTPAAGAIRVDGRLDEAAWATAPVIELPWEIFPGENVEASVRTECRVTYDSTNLYLGCVSHDPRPGLIRATYTDRDRALRDDQIILILDPFLDQRRGFQFRVNAVGVQSDALVTHGSEDFSWDAIWSSAGRITAEGYVVELAIPFRSLSFPRTPEPQSWGFVIERVHPRSAQVRTRSMPVDRSDSCLLCQVGRLDGLTGIAPGAGIELNPTLTASRADGRAEMPGGPMARVDGGADVGLNARIGITPNLSLSATINPDFSQVEADVLQLTVNQRFDVSYPEKRPFFLDGAEAFDSFTRVIFTRSILDPVGGAKLTGREGPHTLGTFVVRDRSNLLLFPSSQSSRSTLLAEPVTTGVFRYQRDVGEASTLGALYTGRSGDGYGNHVAGVDGLLRLTRSTTFRAQLVGSATRYPTATAETFGQPEGTFHGGILVTHLSHASRNWNGFFQFQELTDGFRGDAGFVPRADVRVLRGYGQRVLWGGSDSWYNRLAFSVLVERLTDTRGDLTDLGGSVSFNYQGPGQATIQIGSGLFERAWMGETYTLHDFQASAQYQPAGLATLRMSVRFGDDIDYTNGRKARILQAAPGIDLRLGRHLAVDGGHTYQRLATESGDRILRAHLSRGRVVYNFNARTFLRAMVQYQDVNRDEAQFRAPVLPEVRTVASQFLLSHKVNPQTVLFLGYSDDFMGDHEFNITRSGRTLFMKVGYAFRP